MGGAFPADPADAVKRLDRKQLIRAEESFDWSKGTFEVNLEALSIRRTHRPTLLKKSSEGDLV